MLMLVHTFVLSARENKLALLLMKQIAKPANISVIIKLVEKSSAPNKMAALSIIRNMLKLNLPYKLFEEACKDIYTLESKFTSRFVNFMFGKLKRFYISHLMDCRVVSTTNYILDILKEFYWTKSKIKWHTITKSWFNLYQEPLYMFLAMDSNLIMKTN